MAHRKRAAGRRGFVGGAGLALLLTTSCARPASPPAAAPAQPISFDPVDNPGRTGAAVPASPDAIVVERTNRRQEVILSGHDGTFSQHLMTLDADHSSHWSSEPRFDPHVILPPAWAFGVIHGCYRTQEAVQESVERLIKENYPIDAMWVDSSFWHWKGGGSGYINFRGHAETFPDLQAYFRFMQERKVKTGVWVWDRILDTERAVYDEFDRNGWFFAKSHNAGWHNPKRPDGKRAVAGHVDFAHPQAAARWKQLMAPLMQQGLDFFKLDYDPREDFVKVHWELTASAPRSQGRGFVISHDRREGPPAFLKGYPAAWTGDSRAIWTDPSYPSVEKRSIKGGLKEQIQMVANPRYWQYRLPFLANDTGGYHKQELPDPENEELYIRWVQFSSMGSLMQVFGTKNKKDQNAPYAFTTVAQENFRNYTHLRMRLFPYLYSYAHATRQEGMKMTRGDGVHPLQYLLGRELLVAPVYEPGARKRQLFLPAGARWIDLATRRSYAGGTDVEVDAPLDRLPLFVRAGAIVPMRDYARAVELGRNDPLTLDAYPAEQAATFTLYEDDGASTAYLKGGFTRTRMELRRSADGTEVTVFPADGRHEGQLTARTYLVRVNGVKTPREVLVGGKRLGAARGEGDGWRYEPAGASSGVDGDGTAVIRVRASTTETLRVTVR